MQFLSDASEQTDLSEKQRDRHARRITSLPTGGGVCLTMNIPSKARCIKSISAAVCNALAIMIGPTGVNNVILHFLL